MPHFSKPAEGSWTQHYPHLGTAPISFDDSITPESYELERKAIFERSWLNVGRVDQLPRKGSYFTKENEEIMIRHLHHAVGEQMAAYQSGTRDSAAAAR